MSNYDTENNIKRLEMLIAINPQASYIWQGLAINLAPYLVARIREMEEVMRNIIKEVPGDECCGDYKWDGDPSHAPECCGRPTDGLTRAQQAATNVLWNVKMEKPE